MMQFNCQMIAWIWYPPVPIKFLRSYAFFTINMKITTEVNMFALKHNYTAKVKLLATLDMSSRIK